jgi:hypothetical protein
MTSGHVDYLLALGEDAFYGTIGANANRRPAAEEDSGLEWDQLVVGEISMRSITYRP